MYLAKDPLLDRDRLLQYRGRFVVSALVDEGLPDCGHDQCRVRVLLAVPGLVDFKRLTVVLLGFAVLTEIMLHEAQAVEIVRYERMNGAIEFAIHGQRSLIERIRSRQA